jgi:hypothetical protein
VRLPCVEFSLQLHFCTFHHNRRSRLSSPLPSNCSTFGVLKYGIDSRPKVHLFQQDGPPKCAQLISLLLDPMVCRWTSICVRKILGPLHRYEAFFFIHSSVSFNDVSRLHCFLDHHTSISFLFRAAYHSSQGRNSLIRP